MTEVTNFLIYNIDIVGIIVLIATFSPIVKLMRELPPGVLRKRWNMLIGFIFFFVLSYIFYTQQRRLGTVLSIDKIVPFILFFGSIFVFFVTTLALRTALDVKRIYTLEIENITDPLMGIFNRRHLDRILHEEFSKAVRYKLPFSVLMLDIDFFKKVNDTYGHDIGDLVLKNLGIHMKEFSREADSVARYGGEEILVVCPMTDAQHAVIVAERLRKEIEAIIIVPANASKEITELRITVSIGVADYNSHILSVEDLVKQADKALYRAKSEGRNRVFLCNGTTLDNILE